MSSESRVFQAVTPRPAELPMAGVGSTQPLLERLLHGGLNHLCTVLPPLG